MYTISNLSTDRLLETINIFFQTQKTNEYKQFTFTFIVIYSSKSENFRKSRRVISIKNHIDNELFVFTRVDIQTLLTSFVYLNRRLLIGRRVFLVIGWLVSVVLLTNKPTKHLTRTQLWTLSNRTYNNNILVAAS